MAMYKLFGVKLCTERKKLGLSAFIFAKSCGVSRSYITLIENGKRLPGKKLLPKIAASLLIEKAAVLDWYLSDISHKMQKCLENS